MAEWKFVPKFNEQQISKRGLIISPLEGFLNPNESCCIGISLFIDATSAWTLLNDYFMVIIQFIYTL